MPSIDSGACHPFFEDVRKSWTASAGIGEQNWSDPQNYDMLDLNVYALHAEHLQYLRHGTVTATTNKETNVAQRILTMR
jgi:hypothetical protein